MATNIALKRAKKANRRKTVLADKRKAEAHDPALSARVVSAALAPIRHCLVQDGLFERGIGTLVLARGTGHSLAAGLFLVDVCCLGIKEAFFRNVDAHQLGLYLGGTASGAPFAQVDPSYARKLLRETARWAESIGFPPHRDFAVVERLFGDVDPDASDATFAFGREGKPFYMPGPSEPSALVRRRMVQLRNRFGPEGFHYLIGIEGP
jgi:hypothetical protein